jgi:serine protease AprX
VPSVATTDENQALGNNPEVEERLGQDTYDGSGTYPVYSLMSQPLILAETPNLEVIQITDTCTVDITLHNGLTAESVLTQLVTEAGVDESSVEFSTRKLRMTVDRACLKGPATHDCVRAIEEVFPKAASNHHAGDIMCADIQTNNTSFHGEGQIVTVADTGFDAGSIEECHPAFKDRVIALIPVARKETGETNDPIDHGTHVCGSIVGQNLTSELWVGDKTGGIAPKANLIVQSLFYEKSIEEIRTPVDLSEGLFDPSYSVNSRIHSNSWGEK